MSEEHWKPVAGFPTYLISDQGRIKRDRPMYRGHNGSQIVPPHPLAIFPQGSGNNVAAHVFKPNGQKTSLPIARAVLTAFGPPPPDCKSPQIGFRDGDRTNCALDNLYWKEPAAKRIRRQLKQTAVRNKQRRLVRNALIRRLYAEGGISMGKLAKRFNLDYSMISMIIAGKR